MKRKSFKLLSLIMAFVMILGSFGSFSQPVQAAEDEYKIYPVPQSMTYQDGSFTLSDQVNVVLESGIDAATIARLEEVAITAGVTGYTVSNAVDESKTNILVGIEGSGGYVDTYFSENYTITTEGLFDKLDSYAIQSDDGVITVLGKDTDAAFYGLTSLYHIATQLESKSIRNFAMEDYADVASRGFIEGYYGNPWSLEDRCNLMEWGGYYKLNSYFYAPKDDPKHNSNWRELYTEEELETLIKPLAEAGNASKCRFVFALHPYMYNAISYSSEAAYEADLAVMQAKFAQVIEAGVRQIAILADDASNVGADNYVKTLEDMTAWVREMQKTYPDLKLTIPFCTQEYMGNGQSYYANFPENIQIVMTGGKVWGEVSNSFTTTFTNNAGRGPYMWVNWPCTDNSKQHLIMGGYTTFLHAGVDPSKIQGIVLNPMQQSEPSKVAIFGNACYSWNIWETEDEANQCWNDSFAHVDHKSSAETDASNALRELSKHMINQNMDSRVTALDESVVLKEKLTPAREVLMNNGAVSNETIAELIAEFEVLQNAAATYRAGAADTNIRDQIVYWLDCWDDTTEAAIAYLNALKALNEGASNAVVWDYFSKGQTAFENSKSHGFHYVDHTEYAEVGVQHIVPFISAMESYLSIKVSTIVDPTQIVKTYITNRTDTPTGSKDNVFDGTTATEIVYKTPSNIAADTYVGVLYSKAIDIENVTFNMGTNSNANDRFATAKIQYTEDGNNWMDLNEETYTTADITVDGLNIKAMGIRLVNKAYVDNKWLGVREITVNKGSETDQPASFTTTITNGTSLGIYSGNLNNVIDGDEASFVWFNGMPAANASLTLEFSKEIVLGEMKFVQDSGDKINNGKFEYCDTNDEWHELSTFTGAEAVISEDYTSQNITAKAIRIVNGAATDKWWKVFEWSIAEADLEAGMGSTEYVYTNLEETSVRSEYTDTMTSLLPNEAVTLAKDEYVGIILPRIKDLAAINMTLTDGDALTLETSKNAVDWTEVTLPLAQGFEFPDARYIRLINKTDEAITFGITNFEVVSNEVSGPYLYDTTIGVNSSWGVSEDSRNNGKAFDGNVDTTTEFGDFVSEGEYIIYDLGQVRNVSKLEIYCSDSAVNYIRDAVIAVSNDLESWTDVITIGDGVENTGEASVTCINSDAGYSQATSTYPNKVSIEGEIEATPARYLRILITAPNNERAVVFNEIVINDGEYVPVSNDPTFSATVVEAQGFEPQNMLDGDLTTAYKPGSTAAGSITYTLSENMNVKRMNIIQKGTASNATVSALVEENGEKVWVVVGTLSKSLNEVYFPFWDAVYELKIEWKTGYIPIITEIVSLNDQEYGIEQREALQQYVESRDVKEESYYTASSYSAYMTQLDTATAVYEDTNSTTTQLSDSLKNLKDAGAKLEKRGDAALITAELATTADLVEAEYLPETWNALKAAKEEADALAVKDAAELGETEVIEMVEKLQKAKAALVTYVAVSKAELKQYIKDNGLAELDTDLYMSAQVPEFTAALAEANALLAEGSNATVESLEAAKTRLQNARLALVLKATDAEVNTLKALVDNYVEESYTASSWAVFKVVLDDIKADLENEQTSESIADLTVQLETAAEALVRRGEISGLNTIVTTADGLDAAKYCEESYGKIMETVAKVKAALENAAELTEADVKALEAEFEEAFHVLQEHVWSDWTVKTEATVFDAEVQSHACSKCKKTETKIVGSALAPSIETNAQKNKITLQKKQSSKGFKITDLENGDSIVSITSSNKKVVTISKVNKAKGTCTLKAGKLTGKKGKATITITLASGLKKTIKVTVQKAKVKTTKITGLDDYKKLSLAKGESVTLKPVLVPFTSQDKVKYTTSNKKVAAVTKKGKITAKKKGKATITVKAGKKSFKVKVTVK